MELKVTAENHDFNMTTIDMKETGDYDIYASFMEEIGRKPPTAIETELFEQHFGGGNNETD